MKTPDINFDSKRNKSQSKVSNIKTDNGLMNGNNGNYYDKSRQAPARTFWNQPEDSLNESIDLRNELGFQGSPDIQKQLTAGAMQNNLLKAEDDDLTKMLNKIYLSDCCPYVYLVVAIICVLMIFYVLIQGVKVLSTLFFKIFELSMNLFIIIDII